LYAPGYLALGELHADAGHKEKALENLKKAGSMFEEMGHGLLPCSGKEAPEVAVGVAIKCPLFI